MHAHTHTHTHTHIYLHRKVKIKNTGEEENLWRKEMLAVLGTNMKFIQELPRSQDKKGKRIDSIVTSCMKLIL